MKKPLFLLMLFIGVYINNIIAQSKTDSEKLDEYFKALTAIKTLMEMLLLPEKLISF